MIQWAENTSKSESLNGKTLASVSHVCGCVALRHFQTKSGQNMVVKVEKTLSDNKKIKS